MGCEVIVTAEFSSHVDTAVTYRADNYGLRSARRLLDSIQRTCALLSSSPAMGSLVDRDSDPSADGELRWVRMDTYIAVYRSYEERGEVVLLKLFYGTSNWRRRV